MKLSIYKMIKNLTPRKRKAIEALLTCVDISKAAEKAGVSRQTVYVWLSEPEFRKALDDSTRKSLEGISRSLVTLGEKAVKSLEDILDRKSGVMSKVKAADVILSKIIRLYELMNLENRVAALEKELLNGDSSTPGAPGKD